MPRKSHLFTSESVSEGHPDKVCDQISDAIVDLYLAADPHSRVAVETLATTNRVILAGEVRGPASVTHDDLANAAAGAIVSAKQRPPWVITPYMLELAKKKRWPPPIDSRHRGLLLR